MVEGVTQKELAEKIGIYRGTINAVLNELKRAGLVEIHNKAITTYYTGQGSAQRDERVDQVMRVKV